MNHSIKINFQDWIIIFILLTLILFPTVTFSENIKVSASVDKNQLTLEDTIELSITIQGIRKIKNLEFPPLPDFEVRSLGTQSSTQIFNSNIKKIFTHKFLLIPKKSGQFIIGPAKINLSGTIHKSNAINVLVEKIQPGNTINRKKIFIETNVSKNDPFLNEQLVYTFKLFRRVEVINLNLNMPYDKILFRKEDIGKAKRYSKIIDGINYDVEEISMALFPLKVGGVVIPPSMLELDLIYRTQTNHRNDPFARFFNDPFFGGSTQSSHKVLNSKQINLNVRPMPKAGKPNGFKNLVGRFAITAKLGKKSLELGDTTTLTVTVSGTGNISDVTLGRLDVKNNFKVYPDQSTLNQTIHGNKIGGEKIFKFALIPYSAGEKTIPAIYFSYFDPKEKIYKTISTIPIKLKVQPDANANQLNLVTPKSIVTQKKRSSVQILARDILPIHTQLDDFESVVFNNTYKLLYLAVLIFPMFIYMFASGYIQYKYRLKNDTSYFRRKSAYTTAKFKLKRLSSLDTESKEFVRELSQIIREYIGNKLNLHGTAFTSIEVEKKLIENYFQHTKISSVKNLLEKCDSMQYTPIKIGQNHQLIEESINILNELENQA